MSQYLRRLVLIAFTSALLPYALIPAASAQSVAPDTSGGAPQDWSHRHLIYANPDTRDEAARKGTLAFEEWKRKYKDPRFAQQVARKQRFVEPTQSNPFSPQQLQWFKRHDRNPPATGQEVHRDWSNVLGGVSGVGRAGVFPAKYGPSFTTADCAQDFVVYTTNSAGATSTGAFASQTGTVSGTPGPGGTVTITHAGSPALVLAATAGVGGSNLGLNFQIGATTTATAANLANAITRNGGTAGVTATSAGSLVTVTSITVGATGASTTLASTLTGFAWTAGALAGGSSTTVGQPTIVAFNQLYSSCGTTPTTAVPKTFWSYNTGTGAVAQTSPVLSGDGSQVAFVQTTGTAASLVLLKWSSTVSVGTVGVPTAPSSQTLANYRSCAAPCMTVIPFSGNPNDSNSSPFYDYGADVLYVGADNGTLHKFTGLFSGTPAEQTTGGFPATVSAGNILSSPVYDFGTGLVFVGSDTGASTGGQLHSVSASGTVVGSAQLAAYTIAATGLNTTGVSDSPIVDSGAQRVYTFVESDTNSTCGGVNCKAVYQFQTNVSINNSLGSRVNVGRGQIATRVLYAGTFDNSYYNSADPANPSGNFYICGALADGSDSKKPTLWTIPIVNNTMGTPVAGPVLVSTAVFTDTADCSPVTEVMNGSNDYIFASVSALGNTTGCTGACVYMFQVPTVPISFDRTSTSSTINSGTARFINVSTPAALNTTETSVDTALSAAQAGTYYRMTITQSVASPAGTTFTYLLRSNAGNTTLTCAIAAGATTCSDTTHTASLAAGALVDVRVARSGSNTSLTATFRVQLAAMGGAVPAPAAGLAAPGGTGGIVVDNTAGGGGSQIYYSTITSPGNAVQASQAGLN